MLGTSGWVRPDLTLYILTAGKFVRISEILRFRTLSNLHSRLPCNNAENQHMYMCTVGSHTNVQYVRTQIRNFMLHKNCISCQDSACSMQRVKDGAGVSQSASQSVSRSVGQSVSRSVSQ